MTTSKTSEERIIELLFDGYMEKDIPDILKKEGIKPNSLSTLEKMLKKLKKRHGVTTMFSLGIILYKKKNKI